MKTNAKLTSLTACPGRTLPATGCRRRELQRQLQRQAVRRAAFETLEERRLLSFSPAVPYAVGGGPQAVVTADLNADGRLDVATANSGNSTVGVLLGNGNGTFQSAVTSPTGAAPRSLAVGDFNADGKPDLATAGSAGLSVLLNTGAGAFQAPTSAPMGDAPLSVAVGDFNGDGKMDLVATSQALQPASWRGYYYYPAYYVSSATVLVGNGTGSFTPAGSTTLSQGTYSSIAVADFNGDGKQDLAAASTDNYYDFVLLGTATGLLSSPSYVGGGTASAATAGDVNGDGKADLVLANAYAGGVNVLLGSGTGTFGATQGYATGPNPASAALGDFNADGKADVATANWGDGSVSVLLGLGTGAFQPPITTAAGPAAVAAAVGDFNGDGRSDVAASNGSANTVSVLLNDGVWPALTAPRITIGDVTVTEGNTDTANASFTVSLSAASAQTVTVKYATADGTATVAAGDYQATAGTLTFAPGETSKTIAVPINGDRLVEDSESFAVRLTDAANAFIADGSGAGTILDDEPRITIDYGSGISEGNTGTTPLNFTLRLSAASDVPVSVNYSTAEGDTEWVDEGYYGYYAPPPAATSDVDFQAANNRTLTFAPGETVKTIPVLIIGDHLPEPDEVLSLNLSGASGGGAVITAGHSVGTIIDDEPYVSIASGSITEGNSGSSNMTFTATLSAVTDVPVTVTYATADGTATVSGGDYQAKTASLTFAPGTTTQTFTVAVNGDRIGESTEYFAVNVTGVTNAHPPYGPAYGYIADNEPQISIGGASLSEGNSGTKSMTFTVSLSAAYDQSVTVKFATADGSATVADGDYVANAGTLTFAAGQVTRTFTVTIKGDKKKEPDESFYILLSGASANALINSGTAWGVILSDDNQGGGGHGKNR